MTKTTEQLLSSLMITLVVGTFMYFVGHDTAITKMKNLPPTIVIKNSCWKQTIPHINVWEPMKCPIPNTPIKRKGSTLLHFEPNLAHSDEKTVF